MHPLLFSVEVGISAIFLLCITHSTKYKNQILLVSAIIYAFVFENFNIILSEGKTGSYFYNSGFLTLWHTPIFIVLAWASIIYTAMLLSETLPVKKEYLPFLDALLVILIDLSIDVVAIRLGFWNWNGFSFNESYFGVPAGNFISWILIVFTFSFFTRKIGDMQIKRWLKNTAQIFIFIPSYIAFGVFSVLLWLLSDSLKLSKFQQLFVFAALALIFLAAILLNLQPKKKKAKKPNIIAITRWPFHLFAFAGLIFLARTEPLPVIIPLTAVSLVLISIEIWITRT